MSNRALQILSLGAGVQSTALLLLSIRGELPKLDAAIFADTQWEPKSVYAHLDWLEGEAKRAGIPVHRVAGGNLRQDAIELTQPRASADGKRHASMPLFVLNADGSHGIIRRQCTSAYKIEPIEKFLKRELLGVEPGRRVPVNGFPPVDLWFGVTSDEIHRIRESREYWKRNIYPFIGIPDAMLDRRWTRRTCIEWLQATYPEREIPRSACIGCPYHSDAEWRRLRDEEPEAWRDAVEFDRQMREAESRSASRIKMTPFLHRQCVPLDQVDLRTDLEKGQRSLWNEECEGMCGT